MLIEFLYRFMTIYKDSMTSVQIQLGYDITLMINNKAQHFDRLQQYALHYK